ncbi:MAG: homoserine kinase [bacterium]
MLKIKAPATAANLGPGFDCLGIALDLYNTVMVRPRDGSGISIEIYGEGEKILSRKEDNLVYQAYKSFYRRINQVPPAVDLQLYNQIPLASGLGSSAAAITAGLVAGNVLSGHNLPLTTLLDLAIELEGHPDNVAPAMFGGLVVACGRSDLLGYHCLKLNVPEDLYAVVCVPDFSVSTEEARGVLPVKVPFADAVFNVARVALLLGALQNKRWDVLSDAMQDRLHLPYREALVPGMESVFAQARRAGAIGATLSGSGPTVLALVNKASDGIGVGTAMEKAFSSMGISSRTFTLAISSKGVEAV